MSRYHPQTCKHQQFAGNIEISAEDYQQSKQLWGDGAVILHELAHAFHDKLCADGFGNEDIEKVEYVDKNVSTSICFPHTNILFSVNT